MRADPRAVLDACVLLPMPLADTLLRLAESPRLYRLQWTEDILQEVTRNLIRHWHVLADRAQHRAEQLRKHFPEAWVTGYESLIPSMTNQEKDRHVLAAAVRGGADVIVTYNAKDFPPAALEPWGIERQGPSTFLRQLYDLDPELVEQLLRRLNRNAPAFVSYFCQEQGILLPRDEQSGPARREGS